MGKIYIFAIGGTGSRVLKSLTMLMAAGVKLDCSAIVPIIIDPDAASGNKTEVVNMMNHYQDLYSRLSHHVDKKGKTKLRAFGTKLNKLNFSNDYMMPMGVGVNTEFGTYMDFGSLSDENKAMVNMLYSKSNQDVDMTIGFTGNPNIGSVVLNQFGESAEFQSFAADFQAGDKIFIISSIFGGTGASGFPLLLKNLRQLANTPPPNAAAIANAPIGAITVLPYFSILPSEGSPIDSDTFISKTKSALSYYEKNIQNLDCLYYIGEQNRGNIENHAGGAFQKNQAHFIELASALSIVDFASNGQRNATTTYKEFGVGSNSNALTFKSLCPVTYQQIARPMTEFVLFSKYIKEMMNNSLEQSWSQPYVGSVINGMFYNNTLYPFVDSYMEWLKEMEWNDHLYKFTPFVLDYRPEHVFELAKEVPVGSVAFVSARNWDLVNHFLNKQKCETVANSNGVDAEGKFLAHLLFGIQEVVNEKIKL